MSEITLSSGLVFLCSCVSFCVFLNGNCWCINSHHMSTLKQEKNTSLAFQTHAHTCTSMYVRTHTWSHRPPYPYETTQGSKKRHELSKEKAGESKENSPTYQPLFYYLLHERSHGSVACQYDDRLQDQDTNMNRIYYWYTMQFDFNCLYHDLDLSRSKQTNTPPLHPWFGMKWVQYTHLYIVCCFICIPLFLVITSCCFCTSF